MGDLDVMGACVLICPANIPNPYYLVPSALNNRQIVRI